MRLKETRQKKINALVFVGDCMEEDIDRLCQLAGELGIHNVPVFLFHEGQRSGRRRLHSNRSRD